MGRTATILLKAPSEPSRLVVSFYVPDQAPVRQVRIEVDGRPVFSQTLPGTGQQAIETPTLHPQGGSARVTITLDKSFYAQGDSRELGFVLSRVGFVSP
jgi:hypothetical protein